MNTPSLHDIATFGAALARLARRRNHRFPLVVSGEAAWCADVAQALQRGAQWSHCLWLGAEAPVDYEHRAAPRPDALLGQEWDAVVLDAHSGLDPDLLGAAGGTVRGGGALLLLTPPLAAWPAFVDPQHARIAVAPYHIEQVSGRFLRRLARLIAADESVLCLQQGCGLSPLPPLLPLPLEGEEYVAPAIDAQFRSEDQQRAVEALCKVVTGHRRRPLVLISDRGRGKSAAFGIAAARLLQDRVQRIVITAPRADAVAAVFEQAQRVTGGVIKDGVLHVGESRLVFVPPDELTLRPVPADLVLVDEAAAIPAPLLERLLERYARIAYATTVHGYEGTGRGFALRFQQVLQQRAPQWKALHLETPLRHAPHDPLEHWLFHALLLDAGAVPEAELTALTLDDCMVERVDRDRLVDDEATLAQLFGLLVLAHYRTRPYDLRQLLDGPNLSIYALRWRGWVVATALVAEEGGFADDIACAVYEGRRRLRGHLLPQSLAAHGSVADAPCLRYARLMRIAVHPAVQRRGLGSRLLKGVIAAAREVGYDVVGASFGATSELLRFWTRLDFTPVRVGVTREHTSGTHAVMVLHALSEAGASLCTTARQRLLTQLPHALSEFLHDVAPELVAALLRDDGEHGPPPLEDWEWRDARAYAHAQRGYDACLSALHKLTRAALADATCAAKLSAEQRAVLVMKVLQQRSWAEVAEALTLDGRAAVIEALRAAVRGVMACHE